MKTLLLGLLVALVLCANANAAQLRIGIGGIGPISVQTMADIEQIVGQLPNVHAVPIVPPGDAVACVRRFVAGEPADNLDGVIIVSLPTDSFKVQRDANEAKFSGSYEIYTLELSTLAEDRHAFTFADSEPVTSGMSAILAMPAQLVSQRATGGNLISSNTWEAYQSVQARVEAKVEAATRLYLASASIRGVGPLNRLQCAQQLLDNGEVDAAMAVFKSAGLDNPDVAAMVARAQDQVKKTRASALLGKTLGAIASGNSGDAAMLLAAYEKEPAAQPDRAATLRDALKSIPPSRDGRYDSLLRTDVPGLDRAAFAAMVKQVFGGETGAEPDEVAVNPNGLVITDKPAEQGMKTKLDGYAAALAETARLMNLRCGCDADVALRSAVDGPMVLRARYGATMSRPQVGVP